MRLLGHAGLRRLLENHRSGDSGMTLEIDDGDLDAETGGLANHRRTRAKSLKHRFPSVPSAEGKRLMEGGVFGASDYYRDRRMQTKSRLARKLLGREQGLRRNEVNWKPSIASQVWLP